MCVYTLNHNNVTRHSEVCDCRDVPYLASATRTRCNHACPAQRHERNGNTSYLYITDN